jgi:quinol monooxygenase YgiN
MSVFSVTRTIYEDDVRGDVKDLNRKSIDVFKKQNGFKNMQEYSSRDRNEIMLIIEWDDESCYRACQMSPEWGALMPKCNELMAAEKMRMEIGLYQDMGQAN